MPIARFEMPDGRVARFEVPDGTTPEQAQAMIQAELPKINPLSRTERVAAGMADPFHGGAQLLTKVLPDSVVQAGNKLNNWLADKTGLVARLPAGGVDEQVRTREAEYQARRGDTGLDGYRMLGNVVSPANLALARAVPAVASLGGQAAVGALGGAASSALAPVTEGDFADGKAQQLKVGAIGGAVAPVVMRGVSSVISPQASVNPELQMLRDAGVRPTVGQTLGGTANRIEEKLTSLPFVGDAISGQRRRAVEEFNRAAINRATAPIGQHVDDIGTTGVRQAGDLISDAYEAAKQQMSGFRIDNPARTELNNLRMLARNGLEGKERSIFDRYFRDYIQSKPGLTADGFKELDSKLGQDIARFSRSNDAYQQNLGDALREVQRIIRDNAMRANPDAAQAMRAADRAYANLVRVEGASVGAKGSEGVFTPGQLMTAVRQADRSVRDRATARGDALMQDLASAGTNVLGNRVPDSGTAGRLMMNLGAGGTAAAGMAGLISPTVAIPGAAGLAMYTTPMQRLLGNAISVRPDFAQPVGRALQQAAPAFAPLGSQVGLGLLD